ncbi:TPA: CoA transferase [Klebsiella quasipneumoniae subsp. similipneumoniae]|nr:CoA transferase [Klebsiella quasipneumoniae subsp. similipneumoniae]HCI6409999.1 CoA transferase [Klebsiella quasipneumoniae subsp. similipneumoniae]HCI6655263.1 CoA transferase [Klebsiella quasipneumoniae subsp. similipneumoniae]
MNDEYYAYPPAFSELMAIRGSDSHIPDDEVTITGSDPLFQTPFKVGETAAALLAARGVAANDLWELKTGKRQKIHVDVRAAAATSLAGGDMTLKRDTEGHFHPIPVSEAIKHMVSLTQPWEAADGRWVLPHTNLPHLEKRILNILQSQSTPESVSAGVRKWLADELEEAIAENNACGGKVRTSLEWLSHPHGAYLASRPVVEITKIADGIPEPLPEGEFPASGIKVLDLTRILAGPTAGLGFAEHGADVLMVTAQHLPQVPAFVRDTSHGKRSCFLDMNIPDEAQKLKELVRESDIFIDGYRPGRLKAHGFGTEDLMKLRPGLIHISVNCFGSGGPFAARAGWDQVAQAVTGICDIEGKMNGNGNPKLMPVFTCDFLTGFLATFGGLLALARRAKEGGSYHVQVSLCQSAMLLLRQGLLDNFQDAPGRLYPQEFNKYAVLVEGSPYGDLKSLGPVLEMSETPCKWLRCPPEFGGDKPEWP